MNPAIKEINYPNAGRPPNKSYSTHPPPNQKPSSSQISSRPDTAPGSQYPSRNDSRKMEGAPPAKPVVPLKDRKCVFCPVINDVRKAVTKVYHSSTWDDHFLVLQPIGPVINGHVLVIPHKHVQDATSDWKVFGETCAMASRVASELFPGRDVNIQTNVGLLADQSVPHLHVHVIPRVERDGLVQPWTGQKPGHFNTTGKLPIPESMQPKFPPK